MDAIGKPLFEVFKLKDEHSGELLDLSSNLPKARGKSMSESAIEALLISKNNNQKPVEINFNSIIEQKNNLVGIVLAFQDITSRRLAMKQIKLQTMRAEALVKVAEQLNSRIGFKDVLETVCTVTNQILSTSASMILLYDPKSNLYKDMARRLEFSLSPTDPDSLRIMFDRDTLQAFLPADNSAFSVENVTSRKNIPYKSILRLLKIRAIAVAPLIRNWGCLTAWQIMSQSRFPMRVCLSRCATEGNTREYLPRG
jgi:thiamine phosphate synthase YjbQ (UPF0047 family)